MFKKYIVLFIALVFLLSIFSVTLCCIVKPIAKSRVALSKCCADTAPSNSPKGKDCLSHCAEKKIVTIKTANTYLQEESKTKSYTPEIKVSTYSHNFPLNSDPTSYYYLKRQILILKIDKVYLLSIFNHAPPLFL